MSVTWSIALSYCSFTYSNRRRFGEERLGFGQQQFRHGVVVEIFLDGTKHVDGGLLYTNTGQVFCRVYLILYSFILVTPL